MLVSHELVRQHFLLINNVGSEQAPPFVSHGLLQKLKGMSAVFARLPLPTEAPVHIKNTDRITHILNKHPEYRKSENYPENTIDTRHRKS